MDSGLLTMMEGHTGILECGGNITPVPTGIRGTRGSRGVGSGDLPAAALDVAIHRSQTRPCGEGKAPSPRRSGSRRPGSRQTPL